MTTCLTVTIISNYSRYVRMYLYYTVNVYSVEMCRWVSKARPIQEVRIQGLYQPLYQWKFITQKHSKSPKEVLERRQWLIKVFNWYGLTWPWLHYVKNDDNVLCIVCAQDSVQKRLQRSSSLNLAFILKEFMDWKDVTVKFAIHEASTVC